ncbi:MAG: fumarylacetoacetate hydrolase family protein [Bryobacteraceae bacterium]|nr:fumarylacetoacetate hydrolase family protein [Bryobacteraceae bacterium]
MKLCMFEVRTPVGRHRRLGAATDRGIVDLNFSSACRLGQRLADIRVPSTMRAFLEHGEMDEARAALDVTAERGPNDEQLVYAPGEVRLLAPIPNPASLRDFFSFEQHVKAGFEKRGEPMPEEWYQIPVYYKSGHHNILGPDDDVRWPAFTEKLDYELELACVIGRGNEIAGYTIFNDFSARDIQRREMKVRLGPAKGKDWASALGPALVTPDEIGDPYSLTMTARINGEEWSRGTSANMHWKFEQMIEFLTWDDFLVPGDVIGSGTVGTGCGLELDRWIQRGDTVELEIERIGVLRNRIV